MILYLGIAALVVTSGILGSLITLAAMELRHDCLPHDPNKCRGMYR